MADEKSKNLTGADGPGKDPAKEDKKPEIPKEQKAEAPKDKEGTPSGPNQRRFCTARWWPISYLRGRRKNGT